MSIDPDKTTVRQARAWLDERALTPRGEVCPTCSQRVKVYKRKLSSGMARALVLICHHFEQNPVSLREAGGWLDVNLFLLDRGINSAVSNFALLRHWGLLERKPGRKADGNPQLGLYRITDLGRRFARGECRVRKYVYLYNQAQVQPERPDEETITIEQALGSKFSYSELMKGGAGRRTATRPASARAQRAGAQDSFAFIEGGKE